jgi:RNA polymerase sigma-70 factor (ECF subfamily)
VGPVPTGPEAIAQTGQLDEYYLLHATRADLLRRVGRMAEAVESDRAGLERAPTDAERCFLQRRVQEL